MQTSENDFRQSQPKRQRAYNPTSDIVVPRELALVVGLSSTTVWRLRRAGEFPPPIRLSVGRIGWRRADLAAWLEQREAASR